MIRDTGWSWEYIDQFMDLPRLNAFYESWRVAPPLARMAADYLGYKPRPSERTGEIVNDEAEMAALIESMPTMVLPPVLTPEEWQARKAEKEQSNV